MTRRILIGVSAAALVMGALALSPSTAQAGGPFFGGGHHHHHHHGFYGPRFGYSSPGYYRSPFAYGQPGFYQPYGYSSYGYGRYPSYGYGAYPGYGYGYGPGFSIGYRGRNFSFYYGGY